MQRIIYINKVKVDSNLPAVNFSLGNAYGLAQAGAEYHLCVQKSNQDYDEHKLLKTFNLSPINNLHLQIIQEQRRFGFKTNQWFYLKVLNYVKEQNKNQRVNAVISRDPGALPYLAHMKKKLGTSVFYQPHNFYVDLNIRPDVKSTNAKKYHWLETRYIPKMTALFCLQESQTEWYKKYFPKQKIFVAKPGLFKIHTSNVNRFSSKIIGYVGSLKQLKGVDIVIKAMRTLSQQGFKLLLVGGRNEEEIHLVKKKITESQLQEYVEITGWLPYAKVESYLDQISVGVIPLSDNFYNRYLTAPNKLFDYISRGIPVIASNLPSVKDFLDDGKEGLFFEPGSEKGFIEAVQEMYSSRTSYKEYQKNSFLTAKEYYWSKCGNKMLELIELVRGP